MHTTLYVCVRVYVCVRMCTWVYVCVWICAYKCLHVVHITSSRCSHHVTSHHVIGLEPLWICAVLHQSGVLAGDDCTDRWDPKRYCAKRLHFNTIMTITFHEARSDYSSHTNKMMTISPSFVSIVLSPLLSLWSYLPFPLHFCPPLRSSGCYSCVPFHSLNTENTLS